MIELNDFINILGEKGLLKIEQPTWELLEVFHGEGCFQHYRVNKYPLLRKVYNAKKDVAGIYAYFQESRCIYIGVTKDLRERIYQHLLESCNVWGNKRYKETFVKYPGNLKLYFLPLGDQTKHGDYLRSIVEKILQVKHNPEHESIKL